MLRILASSCLALLLAAVPAEARYLIQIVQADEEGNTVEEVAWQCADRDMRSHRCAQGMLLQIDAKLEPVDLQIDENGGDLRVRAFRRDNGVAVSRSGILRLSRNGYIARSIELWETLERADPAGVMIDDLMFRRPVRRLVSLNVLIEQFAECRGQFDKNKPMLT